MKYERGARKPVLIVDNDPDQIELLTFILECGGHETLGAADGEEAWALLQGGLRPRLILLDLELPGMSGWDLRRQQQAAATLAAIPVIAITGGHHPVGTVLRMGFNEYLTKPIDVHSLLAAASRCR